MRILVTGGAGFVGSYLVEWLLKQNHQVRVFDNLSTGCQARLQHVIDDIEFIQGDIRNLAAIQAASEQIDLVFHLAALVSVAQSVEYPVEAESTNGLGTLHVLEAARQAGAKRVVIASSCAVYGDTERKPISEQALPDPISPYAAAKLAAECLGRLYSRLYEVEAVSLRLFNVYGPGQDAHSPYAAVIPRFAADLAGRRQPVIYGDGGQTRDFVYVGDVVRAMWAAACAPKAAGTVLNLGSGEAYSILDMAELIGAQLGVNVAPIFAPAREGEIRHSQADIRQIAAITGFRPTTPLHQGLAATLSAFHA